MQKFVRGVALLGALTWSSVAWAVVGETAVNVKNAGAPLAGATISIKPVARSTPRPVSTAQRPPSTPPRAKARTDDRGTYILRYDDELHRGMLFDVTVTRGGQSWTLRGLSIGQILAGIDVASPGVTRSSSASPPSGSAQPAVSGQRPLCESSYYYIPGTDICMPIQRGARPAGSIAQPFAWTGMYVGVSGGYGWSDGNFNNHLTTSFGTDEADSGGLSPSSFGADLRLSLPVSNNVGVSAGVWARSFRGDSELGYDLHPTAGVDSFLTVEREWFAMPYLGLTYWCPNPSFLGGDPSGNYYGVDNIAWTAYLGYRYERNTLTFTTDESGGGGTTNTFRRSVNYWAPTVGLDADINLRRNFGPINFVRLGAAYDFGKDFTVEGTSTLGFEYQNRVDVQGSWRIYTEIGYRFGGGRAY